MRPWELIDSTTVSGERGELRLLRRGDEYSIAIAGAGELMSSRVHGSEEALAERGCATLRARSAQRVLVGGLGMGFTLAATLRTLPADAEVVVAELIPAVVRWNRETLGHLAGRPLDDNRVQVHLGDVAALIRRERGGFDAILLDVDNGPEGLTRRDNDRIYSSTGIDHAFRALRPRGVLAVWSAGPDRGFTDRLRRAGFDVEETTARAHGGRKGVRHTIWLARRPV